MRSALADPAKRTFEAADAPAPAPGGIAARALAARAGAGGYLDDLNPEQREAVETLDGPVLVLAGAGTGKTRVLTTRIAHILATGRARPSEILAVTFTNKAAREMKERVGTMVGQAVEGMPWLGTFHAIGVKILRRHAELVGLKSDFTILDVDDQIRLLKQLLEAEHIDEKRWPARVLAGLIDHWKNRGLTPDQVPAGEAAAFANGRGKKLYQAFQERLKVLNAADFGDLLLECIRLFRENPEVLAQYQHRFKYILVDEYQDTNVAQYLWLRLIAQRAVPASATAPPQAEPSSNPVATLATAEEHLLRRRRRPVDLRLARRRGRQHPALRPRLPRRQGDPAGAELPQHRPHSRRGLPSDRAQRGTARQDAAHRGRAGREGHRHRLLGLRGRGPLDRRGDRRAAARRPPPRRDRDPGPRLVPDARVRRPLRHARPALSRDRRAALLRARRNPRRHGLSPRHPLADRRPRLRAHRQHAEARPRRRHHPAAARPRPQAPRPADRSRPRGRRRPTSSSPSRATRSAP